jgi:hypothetical protein
VTCGPQRSAAEGAGARGGCSGLAACRASWAAKRHARGLGRGLLLGCCEAGGLARGDGLV